ncbi:hypothetical protein Taro_049925 [Colocasia esculenta]|uniref:Uncharacterized protein n=1 Tax=Colocasia esculenta TaxID=4460 RepID=A0A843XCD5_COLES|nr:hypothetical protein [Colocasia esculenta]
MLSNFASAVVGVPTPLVGKGLVASFPAGSECELQESVAAVAGCACCERGHYFRSCCGWFRPRPAHPSGCVAKAEKAYVWYGLHRCRAVVCGTGRRCLVCRVAPLVERCDTYLWLLPALCWLVVNSGEVLPEFFSVGSGGGEVWDVGACVVRLWSHVVAPAFRELLCLGGCVPRVCFRIVFDFAGSAGVVSGQTLVVGQGVALFSLLCSSL